ncbi:MAG: hypothetical protein ABW131_02045 [Candidatus Sedimenticola sp. 6PFRAG5]
MEQERELPTIIDIEASGFGRGSYPIEVGVALPDGKTHCFIVCPDKSWTHWDASAEAVHGIPRNTLCSNGSSPAQVATELNRLLAGSTVFSDAWNYDLSWLGKLHDVAGIAQKYRLETTRALISEEQAALWHETKAQVINDLELARHRASSDALIIQETIRRLSALSTR